jgi:REP element-mobilizing transposase RayT
VLSIDACVNGSLRFADASRSSEPADRGNVLSSPHVPAGGSNLARRLQLPATMSRPLRLQFADAMYHVMSRGNARQDIYVDDADRQQFLHGLTSTASRLRWQLLAYCLMPNHYHLCVQTPEPTLSAGMRNVNGGYAQAFNRRHDRVGHLFQGRYKSFLVEHPEYALAVIRYIALNPVRGRFCRDPAEWPWSSHRAMLGLAPTLPSLDVRRVLALFSHDMTQARNGYAAFMAAGDPAAGLPRADHPLVTGSRQFASQVLERISPTAPEFPRAERARLPLAEYQRQASSRDEAIRRAYASGDFSLVGIARHFGLHYSTVSRICGRSASAGESTTPGGRQKGSSRARGTSIQDLTPRESANSG